MVITSKKKIVLRVFAIFFAMLVLLLEGPKCVKADEVDNGTLDFLQGYVAVESYSVTDEQIAPGNDFTLTLVLKNNSNSRIKNVMVSVSNPDGISPKYGTVTQTVVSNIPANGTAEISFDYSASAYLEVEYVDFYVYLTTAVGSNTVNVRIPFGSDNPFNVLSQSFPESAVVGENVVANISFLTTGYGNINNVNFLVRSNGETLSTSAIGSITSGTTKNQGTTIVFDEAGVYNVELILSYTDNTGNEVEYVVGNSQISIHEYSDGANGTANENAQTIEEDNTDVIIIGVSCVLILLVVVAIIFIFKKNRR